MIGATLPYLKHFSVPEVFWNTERYLYKKFRYCVTQQFRRKLVIGASPPLVFEICRLWKLSETQNCATTKCFGTVRLQFGRKIVILLPQHPLLSITFLTPEVFWNSRLPRQKISLVWDTGISTETRDRRPSPSCLWKFPVVKTFWNTQAFFYDMFWCSEAKQIRRRIVILPTPFYPKNLSKPDCFWNTEFFPLQCFPVLWDNNFLTKSRDSLPLLSMLFSKTRFSPKHRRFPYKDLRYCETINVRQKVVFLSQVLPIIFSDTKKFLKHWRFALRKCFVTMRHNNSEVLLHSLPLFHPKIVSILECLWNTEGYSTKGFATVRQKKSTTNRDTPLPLLSTKSFHTWWFLNHREVPLRNVAVLWDKKISTENHVIPLPPRLNRINLR